jgi:hypothetical protein
MNIELSAFGATPRKSPSGPLFQRGQAAGPGDFGPYSHFHKSLADARNLWASVSTGITSWRK